MLGVMRTKSRKDRFRGKPSEILMDWRDHITVDAGRQGGQPCMRGTRIPVYVILDNLAAGESEDTILAEYPTLTRVHIRASLAFAAEIAHDRILPIPA